MINYFKKLPKPGKILIIAISVIVMICMLAGIGTGIYFAVMTKPYEGVVVELGTNTAIADVSVTDGKNVVKTDENGRYRLKGWHKSQFVTVSIPSGYWTENYYVRQSNKLESYDFKLEKKTTDDTNHNFLQVSDTEIGKSGVGPWVYDIKRLAEERESAFIIHTGDICYVDGLRTHIQGMNSNNMGVPVRYVIGNHDYVKYGAYGEALFEELYGPTCYSFDVGNVHYIVTPFLGAGADTAKRYSKSEVSRWVDNDIKNMKDGQKIVMFNHDYSPDENEYTLKYGVNKVDLRAKGLIAWIFGHWHYNFVNENDGILNISTARPESGGIDSSPNGIRVVDIEGSGIKSANLQYTYEYNYDNSEALAAANWNQQLDGQGFWTTPIVEGNSIYVATATDNWPNTNAVYKINASTGGVEWKYDVKNSVRNDIALHNGKILALDVEGRLYAINASTGQLVWEQNIGLDNPRNTSANVLVDGDKAYVGTTDQVYCYNANSGDKIWGYQGNDNISSPAKFVINGDNLIVHCHWRRIFAINKNTGKQVWENGEMSNYSSTSVGYNGNLIYASGDSIIEYSNTDGKILRSKKLDGYTFDSASQPYISGDMAYIGSVNKGVVAFNLSSFEMVWNFNAMQKNLLYTAQYSSGDIHTVDTSIIERDGKLYFGGLDGYVYSINKVTGSLEKSIRIGAPILSKLAFEGANLIVFDFSGMLYSLNM